MIIVINVNYTFTHSICEGSYNYIWFFNNECFLKVDHRFVFNVLTTAAYLTNDFWIVLFKIGAADKLSKQLLVHHVVSIVGIFASVFAGYSFPGMVSMMLLVEISNIFLDLKLLMLKDEYDAFPAKMCFFGFFVTYVIFRIILMPFVLFLIVCTTNLVFFRLSIFRMICHICSSL